MRINAKRQAQLDALAIETIAACLHKFLEGQRLLEMEWAQLQLIEYDENIYDWFEAVVLKTGRGEPPELGGDTLMVLNLKSGRLEVGA